MASESETTGDQAIHQRPETDDYDLLTFGEVAARLSEELAAQTAELERVRHGGQADPDKIRELEDRIRLLQTSKDRYRQEERTNESFARRFGPLPGSPAGQRPQWR